MRLPEQTGAWGLRGEQPFLADGKDCGSHSLSFKFSFTTFKGLVDAYVWCKCMGYSKII